MAEFTAENARKIIRECAEIEQGRPSIVGGNAMSDTSTPRTDAECQFQINAKGNGGMVPAFFARQLERDLAAAREITSDYVRGYTQLEQSLAAATARAETAEKLLYDKTGIEADEFGWWEYGKHQLAALRAENAALKAEVEVERMRLAACGVVAMANTPDSSLAARKMHDKYRSASLTEVESAVDREMALRAENAALGEEGTR